MLHRKKTFIIGTSVVKSIKMKDVKEQSHTSFAKLRSFPGATLKYLKYYVVPFLVNKSIVRTSLHGGDNDVNDKNSISE